MDQENAVTRTTRTITLNGLLAAPLGLALLAPGDAPAQSLDAVVEDLLANNCAGLSGSIRPGDNGFTEFLDSLGDDLRALCEIPGTAGASSTGGASAATQTTGVVQTLESRLAEKRRKKDREGGASADVAFGARWNLFVTISTEQIDKTATAFEDGFDADAPSIMAGADYRFSDALVGGLALSYKEEDGDFDTGGGFDNTATGLFAFGSYLIGERGFVDGLLGYSDKSLESTRIVDVFIEGTGGGPDRIVVGPASGDRDATEVELSVLGGYDFLLGAYTVGPRGSLRYRDTDIDGYTETGSTGVELSYGGDSITSLQGRVGAFASRAFSTRSAVLVPQGSLDLVHEFDNDQRRISARFVQDGTPDPTVFSFQTESPERDWAELTLGVSAVFANEISAFFSWRTYLANDRYDSDLIAVGARFPL